MNWLKKKYYQAISAKSYDQTVSKTEGTTLILSSFAREDNIKQLVDSYSRYSVFNEIIIWHNGQNKLEIPNKPPETKIINSDDLGLSSRYAAGLLACNDTVFFHDDDLILPEESFVELINEKNNNPDRTYCIQGKVPHSDNTYGKAVKPAIGERRPCDIHLNKVICVSRKLIPSYFNMWYDTGLDLDPKGGGGEDIVFSYAVRKLTGQKPLVVGVKFKNLDGSAAISSRYGNQHVNRTQVMKVCQQLLENA
ncbi:MAG: hypothetical protein ABJN36_02335 [Cyclobacteriaceae bacterium]